MAEEIKKEEPKIQLSAAEFIRAMETGKAQDGNGRSFNFYVGPDEETPSMCSISNVVVKEDKIYVIGIDFKNIVKLNKCELNKIHFVDCSFQYGLRIKNTKILKDLSVNSVNINNDLWVENTEIFGDFNLTSCNINGRLILNKKVEVSNIQIQICEIDDMSISGTIIKERFIITSTTIKKQLFVGEQSKLDILSINHSRINSDIRIYESTIRSELSIHFCNIINELYIFGCLINDLSIFKNSIGKRTTIFNSEISILQLPDISENNTLELSSIVFKNIFANDFSTNLGNMKWNNLMPKENAEIVIQSAIMGRWDIINCDFQNVKMVLYSSKITDAFYTNTKFPTVLYPPEEEKNILKQQDILRDGYNQLKTLAQKQNDRKTFLHYQAAELRSYYATLHWYKNFRTWFQLTAMKWSNNFGASWTRGAAFVGIANLIFLVVSFSCRDFDITQAGSFIAYYFEFLFSVVRKPDFISGSWETTWYFISRIFIAFGIYQTVAAFRKFGKSE
jgi:hypothetical protein